MSQLQNGFGINRYSATAAYHASKRSLEFEINSSGHYNAHNAWMKRNFIPPFEGHITVSDMNDEIVEFTIKVSVPCRVVLEPLASVTPSTCLLTSSIMPS